MRYLVRLRARPNRFATISQPTVADYDNFLKRIEGFEIWIDTAIAKIRKGVAEGLVQPCVVIERALPQMQALIDGDPKTSLFYQSILRMPGHFDVADCARLTRAYAEAIEQRIVPSYRCPLAYL